MADSLHTLFTLGLSAVEPSGCELRGRVRIGDRERLARTGARVMLAGTSFSTLTDLDGRFAFRNLPSGRYTVQALATGAELGEVTDLELRRDQPAESTITLPPDPAGDNVVRNARFTLKWSSTETPDWWQRDEKNPRRWASLPTPNASNTRPPIHCPSFGGLIVNRICSSKSATNRRERSAARSSSSLLSEGGFQPPSMAMLDRDTFQPVCSANKFATALASACESRIEGKPTRMSGSRSK
ncbi:MAG: carboxypeptidase regulatory-like domain-containing protein [Planctomycetaceae bacterium]|nr:carboxypeptidase regulatory-like domain-containing protein [Planctomycetaceae bacterium]